MNNPGSIAIQIHLDAPMFVLTDLIRFRL